MNLDPNILTVVDFEIRKFARQCIDHPGLLNDPVCVIATLREDACAALKQSWQEAIRAPESASKPGKRQGRGMV